MIDFFSCLQGFWRSVYLGLMAPQLVVASFNAEGGADLSLRYSKRSLLIESVEWTNQTSGSFTVTVRGPNSGASITRPPNSGSGSMDLSGFGVHLTKDRQGIHVPSGWSVSLTYTPQGV